MSQQTTLKYKVRKTRTVSLTKDCDNNANRGLIRNYPKRSRGKAADVPFTAQPLAPSTLVLKPVTSNENVIEKTTSGKRLCVDPPASPDSISPSKRACQSGPQTPTKRVPLACITPTKTPSKFSQIKFQSPVKSPARKQLFSPQKAPFKSPFKSRLLSTDSLSTKSPTKSPVKIIKKPSRLLRSPYKQPRVTANPACLPKPVLSFHDEPVTCRKKLLKQKLAASKQGSSPALRDAKKLLQSCSTPDRLVGRDSEVTELETFLKTNITQNKAGALYVSGAPGTGKSASLTYIINQLQSTLSFTLIEINCMSHNTNNALYADIATQLKCEKLTKAACQKFITTKNKKKMIVVLLDEVDQLETKDLSVLYTLFEWPSLPNSRLILIGIANALDLTDRVLPRLKAHVACQPKLLHFAPYNKDQIVSILKDRLKEIPHVEDVMDNVALQFCARKVSAITGDIRKALDICRRAIELVEQKSEGVKVTLPFISKVIQEVYGGQIGNQLSSKTSESTLPLQQQLLLCSVAIATAKKLGNKADTVTFGKLHVILSKVCAERRLPCTDFSECVDMCSLLESRGLVTVKQHKDKRQQKVSLRIQHLELERVLEDKTLLSSIMDNAAQYRAR